MATTKEKNWMMRYNEPKAYIAVYYHFSDNHKVKFRGLLNWTKYTWKKIKACTLPEKQRLIFEALEASRSSEHSMGNRKKIWKKTMLKTGKQAHWRNYMAYSSIPSLTTKKLFDYEENVNEISK